MRFTHTIINRKIAIGSHTGIEVHRAIVKFLAKAVEARDHRFRFAHRDVPTRSMTRAAGSAWPISSRLSTYQWTQQDFDARALSSSRNAQELRGRHGRPLDVFLAHCRDRFGQDTILVLKSPELSLVFLQLREPLPQARRRVTVRGPRDQLPSEWRICAPLTARLERFLP